MPIDLNSKIKSLQRNNFHENPKEFYDILQSIELELTTIDYSKKVSVAKKLRKKILTILQILIEEQNPKNRLIILQFLYNLQLDVYKEELFEQIIVSMLEAIKWDTNSEVKEIISRVLYDHLISILRIHENKNKRSTFYYTLYANSEKLMDVYYKQSNPVLKIRLAALLSYLGKNIFTSLFSAFSEKEKYEVLRLILALLADSFSITKLEHPRKDIFVNFEETIHVIYQNLDPNPIRFDLIDHSLKTMINGYDNLPLVYQTIILETFYNLVIFLGEALSEKIIIKFILLLETDLPKAVEDVLKSYLDKLAVEFKYGYKSKLFDKYELRVKQYVETRNSASAVPRESTITFHCYWCGFLLRKDIVECPGCKNIVLKCSVCKLQIDYSDEVGFCSLCETKGHLIHMQEWVKTQGKCPNCLQKIPLEGIILFTKENSKI
ncbi:MAG: hypothetical protein FK733_13875 [Asgard group archaeon]|nr:hypothetical protein [Asgard group archaeon]